jgi:hypothetical protein
MTTESTIDQALGAVCSLDASDRCARTNALGPFVAAATAVEAIAGGVRLRFARTGANARALLDFIRVERTCCARLRYRIPRAADDGPLELEITGDGDDVANLRTFYLGLAAAHGK